MPVSISFSKCKQQHFLNRNGQIHVLGIHEALPKYMSQARNANLHHSDWFKSASHKTAGTQLAHTRCSDFEKPVLSNLIV